MRDGWWWWWLERWALAAAQMPKLGGGAVLVQLRARLRWPSLTGGIASTLQITAGAVAAALLVLIGAAWLHAQCVGGGMEGGGVRPAAGSCGEQHRLQLLRLWRRIARQFLKSREHWLLAHHPLTSNAFSASLPLLLLLPPAAAGSVWLSLLLLSLLRLLPVLAAGFPAAALGLTSRLDSGTPPDALPPPGLTVLLPPPPVDDPEPATQPPWPSHVPAAPVAAALQRLPAALGFCTAVHLPAWHA